MSETKKSSLISTASQLLLHGIVDMRDLRYPDFGVWVGGHVFYIFPYFPMLFFIFSNYQSSRYLVAQPFLWGKQRSTHAYEYGYGYCNLHTCTPTLKKGILKSLSFQGGRFQPFFYLPKHFFLYAFYLMTVPVLWKLLNMNKYCHSFLRQTLYTDKSFILHGIGG